MCFPTSSTTPASGEKSSKPIPDYVPSDPISQAAYQYARQHLHPDILNHSIRVYLFALAIASREASVWTGPERLPLLFTACILHDIGTTAVHDGPQRFEVEGADAAVAVLRSHGVNEQDLHDVWVSIAVHATPGIAERIRPLARLVRMGVAIDFKRAEHMPAVTVEEVQQAEDRFPRGEIEKELGDAVVEQARRQPDKAPAASWPGVLLKSARENPDWVGVNKAF